MYSAMIRKLKKIIRRNFFSHRNIPNFIVYLRKEKERNALSLGAFHILLPIPDQNGDHYNQEYYRANRSYGDVYASSIE